MTVRQDTGMPFRQHWGAGEVVMALVMLLRGVAALRQGTGSWAWWVVLVAWWVGMAVVWWHRCHKETVACIATWDRARELNAAEDARREAAARTALQEAEQEARREKCAGETAVAVLGCLAWLLFLWSGVGAAEWMMNVLCAAAVAWVLLAAAWGQRITLRPNDLNRSAQRAERTEPVFLATCLSSFVLMFASHVYSDGETAPANSSLFWLAVVAVGTPCCWAYWQWKTFKQERLEREAREEWKQELLELAQLLEVAEKVLEVAEKALGPNHPDVATSLNNLARLQDEYALVEFLLTSSLRIREMALGACLYKQFPGEPDGAARLKSLELFYRETKRKYEAEKLEKRAASIRAANDQQSRSGTGLPQTLASPCSGSPETPIAST